MLRISKLMNRVRSHSLPVVLYILLLMAVWLSSWVSGIVSLFVGEEVDFALASTDGVRWFLRTSVDSISSLPWGIIILLLMSSGLFSGCGLPQLLLRMADGYRSVRSRRALWAAFIAFVVVGLPLLLGTLNPLSLASGVDGSFVASPLVSGALFVVFVVALFVSVAFGVVYGTFRSVADVADAACCHIRRYASSLVALVPAALLLASLDYMGLSFMQSTSVATVVKCLLLLFPFVYSLFFRPKSEK